MTFQTVKFTTQVNQSVNLDTLFIKEDDSALLLLHTCRVVGNKTFVILQGLDAKGSKQDFLKKVDEKRLVISIGSKQGFTSYKIHHSWVQENASIMLLILNKDNKSSLISHQVVVARRDDSTYSNDIFKPKKVINGLG